MRKKMTTSSIISSKFISNTNSFLFFTHILKFPIDLYDALFLSFWIENFGKTLVHKNFYMQSTKRTMKISILFHHKAYIITIYRTMTISKTINFFCNILGSQFEFCTLWSLYRNAEPRVWVDAFFWVKLTLGILNFFRMSRFFAMFCNFLCCLTFQNMLKCSCKLTN